MSLSPIHCKGIYLEHPKLAGYTKEILRAIQEGGTGNRTDYNDAKTFITAQVGASSVAMRYLDLYSQGTRHFKSGTYVFKVAIVISRRTNLAISFGNVNTIYSNAQLIREAGAPGPIGFSIASVTQVYDTPGDGYTLGWLKSQPALVQVGGGRFQIQLEYELDQWSTDIYHLSSASA
jgi:hypothetical protein